MLDPNFLCACGHKNRKHITIAEALKNKAFNGNPQRLCVEYRDYPNPEADYLHATEEICKCNDFVPDNLRTLELFSEKVV